MTLSSRKFQNNPGGRLKAFFYILLLISFGISTACTSKHASKKPDHSNDTTLTAINDTSAIQNLVSVVPPLGKEFQTGSVYIDSVRRIIHDQKPGLLIAGSLPSGCSNLLSVDHSLKGDTLTLQMRSWRPKNKMCTQQLVPFSYLYYPGLSEQTLQTIQRCNVNGHVVTLNP